MLFRKNGVKVSVQRDYHRLNRSCCLNDFCVGDTQSQIIGVRSFVSEPAKKATGEMRQTGIEQ
jgi:hypothetical protein